MGTFIPNTKEEQLKMLNEIGYKDFDDLFKVIPAEAKVKGELPQLTLLPTKKNSLQHTHLIRLRSARVSSSRFLNIRL